MCSCISTYVFVCEFEHSTLSCLQMIQESDAWTLSARELSDAKDARVLLLHIPAGKNNHCTKWSLELFLSAVRE